MTSTRQSPDAESDCLFAAVLAAGRASRFGSVKQLAEIGSESLVRRSIRLAESVVAMRSLLCAGYEWRMVFESASPLKGFLVLNPDYAKGMAGSIASCVRVLPDTAQGLLLLLADQPLVGRDDLGRLVRRWNEDRSRIVCSRYSETIGPPAIFPARFFPELIALEGDRGARAIIERHRDSADALAFDAAGIDVDKPEDLSRIPSID